MNLNKLLAESAMILRESTTSVDNSTPRPELESFTRAVNNLIYMDMVAVQPTSQPIAALYGLRYKNTEDDMSYTSPATYGGQYGNRKDIDEVTMKAYNKGEIFKFEKTVYQVCKNLTLTSKDEIYDQVMIGNIRMASEAANTDKFESADSVIEEANFSLDKWEAAVKTRKLKTSITVEAAQDLEHSSAFAENVIDDFLATMISEEINKDIIHKMITVSKRFKVKNSSENGILVISDEDYANPLLANKLLHILNEMASVSARKTGFSPTYVLATSRIAGILTTTGLEESDIPSSSGILKKAGLELFVDTTTPFDYMIVGIKQQSREREDRMETVGSLVYSPYQEMDESGSIKLVVDPASLQPSLAIMVRYALSANPYTMSEDEDKNNERVMKGDDWNNLSDRSDMSMMLGIKLPDYINADED